MVCSSGVARRFSDSSCLSSRIAATLAWYFSGAEKCVIYFVVNRFQIPKVKHLVTTIDPAAFITVTEISDVMGTSVKQK